MVSFWLKGRADGESTKLWLGIEGGLISGIVGFRGLNFGFNPFIFGFVLILVGWSTEE